MKLYLRDQARRFDHHLEALKKAPVMKYDRAELKEKFTAINIYSGKSLLETDTGILFNYDIFPSSILTFYSQWEHEQRSMRVGDTIVQQIHLPPLRRFSLKMIMGVRICEIITREDKIGFSYETLEGHVEKGISSFYFENSGNQIRFAIRTLSSAGNLMTRISAPVFSSPYQNFCTGRAMRNVKLHMEE